MFFHNNNYKSEKIKWQKHVAKMAMESNQNKYSKTVKLVDKNEEDHKLNS